MTNLLHLDSSIRGADSRSRQLSARYAAAWRAAHPGGTVTYRDLAADPLPHLDLVAFESGFLPPEAQGEAHRQARALTDQVVGEVLVADTIVIGAGLYNFGVPSTVKAWADRIVVPGVTLDPSGGGGLLGGRKVVLALAAGGGYGPGTLREGWDHRAPWFAHFWQQLGVSDLEVFAAELTLARESPAMAALDLGAAEDASFAAALEAIDGSFQAAAV